MKLMNKIMIVILSYSLLLPVVSMAEDTESPDKNLNDIMKGLLVDTHVITEGIFLEDFKMIEKGANHIADHPKAPMATRMKLAKVFGPEMKNFKSYDITVHSLAVEMAKAATEQDMTAVVSNYKKLIDGCQACHNGFKKRVVEILK